MTPDDIIARLKASEGIPYEALTQGIAHAGTIAPFVVSLCQRAIRGVFLIPSDRNVARYGLTILAAARYPGLHELLLQLVRCRVEDIEHILVGDPPSSLARLLFYLPEIWGTQDGSGPQWEEWRTARSSLKSICSRRSFLVVTDLDWSVGFAATIEMNRLDGMSPMGRYRTGTRFSWIDGAINSCCQS